MKNTNRIRRNRTARAPSPQAKSPADEATQHIVIMNPGFEMDLEPDRFDGSSNLDTGFFLPSSLIKKIKEKARRDGISLDIMFHTALGHILASPAPAAPVPSSPEKAPDLEDAMRQSNALLMLVSEHVEYNRLEGSNFTGGDDAEPLSCGLQLLVWQTQEQLAKAVYAKYQRR
jgi:hypothetical protein